MDYISFRINHDMRREGSIHFIGNKKSKSFQNLLHLLEDAFEQLFEECAKASSHQLPVWLFELFDNFVKSIENELLTLDSKWENVLSLAKELHFKSYLEFGPEVSNKIFQAASVQDSNSHLVA